MTVDGKCIYVGPKDTRHDHLYFSRLTSQETIQRLICPLTGLSLQHMRGESNRSGGHIVYQLRKP